ncbi:MAG: DUF305 domain-containing protein [Micromonosporaceae bacterium]|nr:DUF305 domain-containing protein [Micromonosporaceae bacterium]
MTVGGPGIEPVDKRVTDADSVTDESPQTPADGETPEEAQPVDVAARPRRGLTPLVAALLAVMVGLTVGFAAGVFTAKPSYPGEDSPEAGFARDMSTHHGQAVEMGMIAWQRASLSEVRQLAYDIAVTQQGQIGIMLNWTETWGVSPTSADPPMSWMGHGEDMVRNDGLMAGMATREQIDEMRAAKGEQVDILFCKLMIDHHIGGVHMAEGVVELSDRPEVVELAKGMIAAQDSEIKVLRGILAKLGEQ